MSSRPKRLIVACAASGALLLVGSTAAQARETGGANRERVRASSYINRDTGAATENADVTPGSSCFRPDRSDTQQFSDPGSTARNVHNDACFLMGDRMVDGPASFESRGVGFISACPDPDGAGAGTSTLSDKNGDGRMDLCFQTGFQDKVDTAGNGEFHTRLNNDTGIAGRQTVVFCADRDQNGCSDETVKSTITIDWNADGVPTPGNGGGGNGGGQAGLGSFLSNLINNLLSGLGLFGRGNG